MNRKSRLRLAAIVAIFCTMAMTLTSCKDDTDDLVKPVTGIVTEADMKQAALGLHLDFSGIAVGTDRVRVWDFKDNNRFIAYDYYTDEDYEFAVDTFSGTWKTFVNQTLDWDIDEQIKVSGISVVFDDEVNLPGNLDGLSNFYGFMLPDENNKASDDMFFLSEASLAYLAYNESLSEHPEIYEDEGVDDDEDFDPFLAPTRAGSQSSDNTLENEKVTLLGKVSQKVDLTPQSISTTQGQALGRTEAHHRAAAMEPEHYQQQPAYVLLQRHHPRQRLGSGDELLRRGGPDHWLQRLPLLCRL